MSNGLHVLGVTKPRKGPTGKGSKGSKGKFKIATGKGKPSPHRRGLDMAAGALQHGQDVAKAALSKASSYHPTAHKPLVPLVHTGTTIHGTAILGAVTPHPLTHKQRLAVEKHVNAIARHHAAVTNTAKAAHKLQQTTKVLSSSAAKAAPPIKNLGKRGTRYILGIGDVDALASQEAEVQAQLAAAGVVAPHPYASPYEHQRYAAAVHAVIGSILGADPDPSNPGFLTDGTIDPAFLTTGPQSPIDPTQWGLPALTPDYTDLGGANPDPNLTPLPTRGGALSDADTAKIWATKPADCVVYDDVAMGLPDGSVGSYRWFKSGYHDDGGIIKSNDKAVGYIWSRRGTHYGSNQDRPRWMAQNDDDQVHDVNDDGTIKDPSVWAALVPFADFTTHAGVYQFASGGGDPGAAAVARNSVALGWGPLVGRPDGPLAGLQFAVADGVWFWQSQNAPANMSAAADAALADLNAKLLTTDNGIIDTTNATIIQEATQMAEDAAKAQAAQAIAENAAVSQANIAQVQQGTQAAQQDLDQQRAQAQFDLATQQAQLQMAQQQAAIDAQAQQAMIPIEAAQAQADIAAQQQAQQAWLDYIKANPEAAFGPQAPQGMPFDPSLMTDALMSAYYGVGPTQQEDGSGGSFDFGDTLE